MVKTTSQPLTSQTLVEESYPSTEEINQSRLLDACVEAVRTHGLDHLQMNHIIEQSGFSRRTVYKYFKNKSEIVSAAYLQEGARLYESAKKVIEGCQSIEDVFVYSFLYVHQNLPKNPLLKELVHNHQGLLDNLNVEQTILETLKGFNLEEMFSDYPDLNKEIYSLSEYWIHAILSFLLLRSGERMTVDEVEQYVRRRFVPGLHLEDFQLNDS